MTKSKFLVLLVLVLVDITRQEEATWKIWGPGLSPDVYTMPARYFFVEPLNNYSTSLASSLKVAIEGFKLGGHKPCMLWPNTLQRPDGTLIVRYKQLGGPCENITLNIQLDGEHVGESPYKIEETSYSEECSCPDKILEEIIVSWNCGLPPTQIRDDFDEFQSIDWSSLRQKVIKTFNKPHSVSICHYVVKNNELWRKCYGKYVGFNMFMDGIILSILRKTQVPDLEFFVNLGDWPLALKKTQGKFPIFSWCGSQDSWDIVMPTYDLTESTLENMGRVMLDMLSVQGNVEESWSKRIPKLFWRGRDSNKHRLDLIDISRQRPDLFNVSLTNFFFFRDKQEEYGPKAEHESFFKFFNYKYQLGIDGTVAPYRMPYLLAGGSLVFKPSSKYYEHFYNELTPFKHFVPLEKDLSDLLEKLEWALKNDKKAQKMAELSQQFSNENLLPKNIFCYHMHLFHQLSQRITSKVEVLSGMELITDPKSIDCGCAKTKHDEL